MLTFGAFPSRDFGSESPASFKRSARARRDTRLCAGIGGRADRPPSSVDRLRAAGADIVYRETASGTETRVELAEMIDQLRGGDVVLVTRLDHLAETPEDLALIVAAIVDIGARFHSLRWAERHRGGLLSGSIDRKLSRTKRAS